MTTSCFWLDRHPTAQIGFRRYRATVRSGQEDCPVLGYHHTTSLLFRVDYPENMSQSSRQAEARYDWPAHDDPRWPSMCPCGYEFTDADPHQRWTEPELRRSDTGELVTLRSAPDGAMWDAFWLGRKGPDGLSVAVRCPGGHEWTIDERARNCTLRDDDVHRCWVRHGKVPWLTVDKNGLTCGAGAGSIQTPNYHGFLREGVFEP